MKRLGIVFLILVTLLVSGFGIREEEKLRDSSQIEPDCVVCNDLDGEYWLTIIANQDKITDKETFALRVIEQARNNEFKTILFSYDEKGYPIGLKMSVYLTEDGWKDCNVEPYMKISFGQENIVNGYNIVEQYEKFLLEIN